MFSDFWDLVWLDGNRSMQIHLLRTKHRWRDVGLDPRQPLSILQNFVRVEGFHESVYNVSIDNEIQKLLTSSSPVVC
jgi:hypothetical protein